MMMQVANHLSQLPHLTSVPNPALEEDYDDADGKRCCVVFKMGFRTGNGSINNYTSLTSVSQKLLDLLTRGSLTTMSCVYVGNLDPCVSEDALDDIRPHKSHCVESTTVDAKTQSMQLATKNISLQNYMDKEDKSGMIKHGKMARLDQQVYANGCVSSLFASLAEIWK